MDDKSWLIKEKNDWALFRNEDMECNIALINLLGGYDKSSKEELYECVKKSYQEYYRPSRKNRIIVPEILDSRHLVFFDSLKGLPMADFVLRNKEDILRDFKLASQLERGITEFHKKRLNL